MSRRALVIMMLAAAGCGTADQAPSSQLPFVAPGGAPAGPSAGSSGALLPGSGQAAPGRGAAGAPGLPGAGTLASAGAPSVPRLPQPMAAGASAAPVAQAGMPAPAMPPSPMGMMGMPTAPAEPATPAPAGAVQPMIPALTAECPQFRNGNITFMGLGGITMVAGPKAAGPTAPMVFYWHGTGSTAGEYVGAAAATNQGVVAEGGVLISFQGSTGGDLLSGTSVFGMGDLALTDQLVACAVKNHNVDPRRIYTTGCSAGGLFAASMATLRSSYVAAAAPNSGGWTTPLRFQTMFTPALMTMHGAPGADVVIVDFSQTSTTADRAFKAAGGFVINCNHGGGHCGARALAGDVWKFFKAHPYGVKPSPWAGGLPTDFSNVCKIY